MGRISWRRSLSAQSSDTGKSFGFFPTGGVYAVSDPNLKNPQVNTWNLSIQHQVGKWLISGSYLGNHTAHLWSSRELNLGAVYSRQLRCRAVWPDEPRALLQHQRLPTSPRAAS